METVYTFIILVEQDPHRDAREKRHPGDRRLLLMSVVVTGGFTILLWLGYMFMHTKLGEERNRDLSDAPIQHTAVSLGWLYVHALSTLTVIDYHPLRAIRKVDTLFLKT